MKELFLFFFWVVFTLLKSIKFKDVRKVGSCIKETPSQYLINHPGQTNAPTATVIYLTD